MDHDDRRPRDDDRLAMTVILRVDRTRSIVQDASNSHNRWFPGLTPVASVAPGEELVAECRDGMDGALLRARGPEDLIGLELESNHPLTGPIEVRGAEPGDVLVVETLAIEPDRVGATAVIPGFGLLGDLFDEPSLVRWEISDGVARSPDLPGIAIRGAPFMGSVGVAPSDELLQRATERERVLLDQGEFVLPPTARGAAPPIEPYASHGLRTIPPRENGGNLDIRQLGVGSRLLLPVHVPGALLSVGDLHFAQGDGESCGTAIEVAGVVTLRVGLRRSADLSWRPRFPALEFVVPAAAPRPPRRHLATTGIPLASDGENRAMDIALAARGALDELVEYVVTRGYTRAQAYVLASVAADLRIAEAVNVPNALVTASLALDVFEER
jgi:formamidase